MTIALGLVSALILILWPLVFVWNLSLHDSDAAGNGLATVYTVAATLALWLFLAVAVVLRSGFTSLPALILLPLSGAAALAVTMLLSDREPIKWMLIIQGLTPLLILIFVRWPNHPRVPIAVWTALLILGLLPWRSVQTQSERKQQRIAAMHAAQAERDARFQRLTEQSPVRDWMQFLDVSFGVHDETVRRIKALPHKQQEIEQMLNQGDYTGFESYWEFELTPTPQLCQGIDKFLNDQAISLKPSPTHRRFRDIEIQVNSYEYTLRWFAKNGCHLRQGIDALKATLLAYPDAKQGSLFLSALDEIRDK